MSVIVITLWEAECMLEENEINLLARFCELHRQISSHFFFKKFREEDFCMKKMGGDRLVGY